MQQTSALYRQILSSDNHYFETRLVIGDSGNLVTETGEQITFGGTAIVVSRVGPDSGFNEEQLFSVRTDIQMFGDEPIVGKAVAGEIDVEMLKPAGEIQRMGVIIPYVRAVGFESHGSNATIAGGILSVPTGSLDSSNRLVLNGEYVTIQRNIITFEQGEDEQLTSEWLQQGKFYIDTREHSHNDDQLDIITIHGYDAMMRAEQDYVDTSLDWPALDTDVVSEIARKMGVSIDPRTWDIMTDGYHFPLPASYSLREVLGFIAGAYAGSFVITDTGDLRLVSMTELPKETRYLVDEYGYSLVFGDDRILL